MFMRLHDKNLMAAMHKELFHLNFHHFMELEGKYNTMEIAEELGISFREVMIMRKKINRT